MKQTEEKQLASVVIPAYNAEDFIKDAVKSCFIQTHRPLEIIVVNDGSTDSTIETTNRLADSISDGAIRLRIISVGENKGTANALKLGFASAEGDYICWLSADDIFIEREKMDRQIEVMNKTGACWSYYRDVYLGKSPHDAILTRSSYMHTLRALDPLFLRSSDLRLMAVLFKNPINGSSAMIRRECIEEYGQFDPATKNVDPDGDLWMRYSALNLKLAALHGAPVFYREHTAQTSKRTYLMLRGCELTRLRILLTLERKGSLKRLIAEFAPFLPIVFEAKYHFERPLVTEFLLNYILTHKKELAPLRIMPLRRYLRAVKDHKNYHTIDTEEFHRDLKTFSESNEYKAFESIFLR